MALINILAFTICLMMLSYALSESLTECLPVLFCLLILVLYGLAVLHHLSWIDGLGCLVVVSFIVWFAICGKEKRKNFIAVCRRNMTQPSFFVGLLSFVMIAFGVSGKVVTWWDDINFWATDVKALYFLDGFAGRYGNVAPSFGDYPPGSQMIKWWFLHLSPGTFKEGLAFIGYYTMNMVFMLPVFRRLNSRNPILLILSAVVLWIFPSIAEVYGYDGFCADLTMACIYGSFLFGVTDREGHKELFYYGRLMLYLGVLVLIKSTGFIWVLFGLVFAYGCFFLRKREGGQFRAALLVTAAPLATGGSWLLLCFLLRRVTQTTATAVKYITTDEYGLSGYLKEFATAFLEAFVKEPLHKTRGLGFDLTPLTCYVFIAILLFFFLRKGVIPLREGRFLFGFVLLSGIAFYLTIFLAHLTIFATETQYLEASGMIASIERYGAPFTIGTLLFLACVWMERGEKLFSAYKWPSFYRQYVHIFCMILLIFLTAQWRISFHGLIGYRKEVPKRLQERTAMLDEEAVRFLQALDGLGKKESARVYCIQGGEPRWVRNSYTNLEAAPVSVVYQNINLQDAPADWLAQEIIASHASYLYVEEMEGSEVLQFFLSEKESSFTCNTLYRIVVSEEGKIRLE